MQHIATKEREIVPDFYLYIKLITFKWEKITCTVGNNGILKVMIMIRFIKKNIA